MSRPCRLPCFALLLLALGCSDPGEHTVSSEPMPEEVSEPTRPADAPAWHVRHALTVTEDDDPVAGATVYSLVEGRALGRTDEAGQAVVWASYDDTLLAVRGEGPDAPAGIAMVGLVPPPHTIDLRAPRVVEGTVRSEGAPVSGALVTLGFHPAYSMMSPRTEGVAERPAPEPPFDGPRWRRRCRAPVADLRVGEPDVVVRTDAEGRFSLRARVDEVDGLEACAPDLVGPAWMEPRALDLRNGEPVDLELVPVRRIRGRVVDASGAPVESARVEALRARTMGLPARLDEELVTDADGRFVHDAHPDLPVHFVARDPHGARATHHPAPDAREVLIRLAPSNDDDER